ncbi:thiol-disulfide oxidoreductase DCC family protein [Streptomyces meridianus]|uniref:DUF393 domain-containing protein n=1 Tax=Streptomyces meridianus TaxID=2938945 RepID=A0ABT0X6Z7_9ACTN|nr:DCC1-like thiol-disulfide oxidoreductase family protein [Streptomyces meridianus]MCM2578296.1 DUF393 domain-containing protein [Streptomyces meridianus]
MAADEACRGATAPAPMPPVTRLTVLHDPGCPLCRHLSGWLRRQRQLVPLEFVAVGSDEARARFPDLDQVAAFREITVVADGGQVWTGPGAFVTCLWALAEHRPLAHRLSTPAGLPLARGAALAASKYRGARWRRVRPRLDGRKQAGRPGPQSPWLGWGGDAWDGVIWPDRPGVDPDACDGQCPAPD